MKKEATDVDLCYCYIFNKLVYKWHIQVTVSLDVADELGSI